MLLSISRQIYTVYWQICTFSLTPCTVSHLHNQPVPPSRCTHWHYVLYSSTVEMWHSYSYTLRSTFFIWHNSTNWVMASSYWSFRYLTQTQYTRYDSSVRVIGPSHRSPHNNAQNSQDGKISILPARFEPAISLSQQTVQPLGPVLMNKTVLHCVTSRRVFW